MTQPTIRTVAQRVSDAAKRAEQVRAAAVKTAEDIAQQQAQQAGTTGNAGS